MGKLVGIAGTLRGKVGAMVFTKGENGETYAKSYQPQVANPKTDGQLKQRAKMNLAGKISALVPTEILVGLGGNKRGRRSLFNHMIMGAITVDTTVPGTYEASIEPANIIFSKGEFLQRADVTTQPSSTVEAAIIGLTMSDTSLVGKYGERLIVVAVDPEDKGGISLVNYVDVVFSNTTEQNVSVPYNTTIATGTMVSIYRVPFILSDRGAEVVSTSLANDGSSMLSKVLLGTEVVSRWGASTMAKSLVFTAA